MKTKDTVKKRWVTNIEFFRFTEIHNV
jgi:hypothetical protein